VISWRSALGAGRADTSLLYSDSWIQQQAPGEEKESWFAAGLIAGFEQANAQRPTPSAFVV